MSHPYKHIPTRAHWFKKTINDPIVIPKFKIQKQHQIVTAGSCFARRIALFLKKKDQYLITETVNPILDISAEKYNYNVFSARYDNIYTSRQLLQLFDRAYGYYEPDEGIWERSDDKFVDAFRPRINPDGYFTTQELIIDRRHHLACVRQAFEKLDVFIFTLGLSEAWLSKKDGAVYPLCPGVDGGKFDDEKYYMKNFTVSEIAADFLTFSEKLLKINPNAKIIITVSPTPIMATATDNHILVANFYTKSALRAACTEIITNNNQIEYFPSYDLVLGGCFSGINNFEPDQRTPTEESIKKVMDIFFESYFDNFTNLNVEQEPKLLIPNFEHEICDNILEDV